MIPPLQILGYSIVPADAIKLQSSSCFTFHMDGPWFSSSQRGWHSLDNYPTVVLLLLSCILDPSVARQVTAQMRKSSICIPKLSMASESIGSYDYRIGCKGGSQSSPRDFMESLSTFGYHESNVSINRTASLHLCRRLGFPSPLNFLSLIDTLHSGNINLTTAAGRVFIPWDRSPVHYDIFTHQSHSQTAGRTASPALLGATGPTTPIRP